MLEFGLLVGGLIVGFVTGALVMRNNEKAAQDAIDKVIAAKATLTK